MTQNHSVIENARGLIREMPSPETRIRVIEALQQVLKFERLQAIKELPGTDSDLLLFVDGSVIDQEPQLVD
jgi:hypothetical protein